MNAQTDISHLVSGLEGEVSTDEWQTRVDLAAAYRLVRRSPAAAAVNGHVARAPAELRGHLEQRDFQPPAGRLDRCCQPGPTAADHRDLAVAHQPARQFVRMAIQSLRSGVSEMRWCKTWKPSASISRSSVR